MIVTVQRLLGATRSSLLLMLTALLAVPRPLLAQPAVPADAPRRRRRSEPRPPGSVVRRLSRHQRPHAADGRPGGLRAGSAVRARDVHAAQEPAGALVDARSLGADLRNLQDLPDHAGQVHPAARGRSSPSSSRSYFGWLAPIPDKSVAVTLPIILLFSLVGIARQLRRRLVRHPRQHVRELAGGVRQPARQAVSDLRHPAARRHEHRHAADQRRAAS